MTRMRTVLITGTSSGLGKSCVGIFAARGWNVIASRRGGITGAKEKVGSVLTVPLDVTDQKSINAAVRTGIEEFGGIDMVINNAGVGVSGTFEDTTPEQERLAFEINTFGPMRVIRAVLPHFRERRTGVIVNITSAAGVFALPATSIYTSTKFALEGFSEAIAYELLSQNIVVKIMEPGGMSGTRFVENSTVTSRGTGAIPDYADFVGRTRRIFDAMPKSAAMSVEAVAERVYAGATDGTDRLRYLPTDDVRQWIELRRGGSDERFMDQIRLHMPGR